MVLNLERNSTTISWTPPTSLNLTNVEPDIVYCVGIYDITCGERNFLISDCSVTEPHYIYNSLLPGHIYSITITPRSNVEASRNGTSLTEEGTCTNYLMCGLSVAYLMHMCYLIDSDMIQLVLYFAERFVFLNEPVIVFQYGDSVMVRIYLKPDVSGIYL